MIKSAVFAFFISTASAAGAASFDCEKAAAPDEKAICADRASNDAADDRRLTDLQKVFSDVVARGPF